MQLKDDAGGHALLIGMSIVVAFLAMLVLAQTVRSDGSGTRISGQSAAAQDVPGERHG